MSGESKLFLNCTASCTSVNNFGITRGANIIEFREERKIAFVCIVLDMKGIPRFF